MKIGKIIEFFSLTVLFGLLIFIYAGFFFPDPYIANRFGDKFASIVTIGIRIIFPLLSLLIFYLYYLVKRKKLLISNIILSIVSMTIFFLVLLPIVDNLYYKITNMDDKIRQYHPFLQLLPQQNIINEGNYNIICLGGSTTEWKDINNQGWPVRLEKLLNKKYPNKKIKVHNAGKQWFTSLHSLINYQTNIRHFKPDVIILMHGINDLLVNADESYFSHKKFRNDYGHFYGAVNRIIDRKGFISEILGSIRVWYHKPRKIIELDNFPGLKPFKRNINTIIDLAYLDSTKVILISQPFLYRDDLTEREIKKLHMVNKESYGMRSKWSVQTALKGMQKYNLCLKEISSRRKTDFIDLEKSIPKSLIFFEDDVHYTEKTFDLIAKTISDNINGL